MAVVDNYMNFDIKESIDGEHARGFHKYLKDLITPIFGGDVKIELVRSWIKNRAVPRFSWKDKNSITININPYLTEYLESDGIYCYAEIKDGKIAPTTEISGENIHRFVHKKRKDGNYSRSAACKLKKSLAIENDLIPHARYLLDDNDSDIVFDSVISEYESVRFTIPAFSTS